MGFRYQEERAADNRGKRLKQEAAEATVPTPAEAPEVPVVVEGPEPVLTIELDPVAKPRTGGAPARKDVINTSQFGKGNSSTRNRRAGEQRLTPARFARSTINLKTWRNDPD